jgi:hypothetical protein
MAPRKNPLDKLVSAATGALKDPVGTAGKAVEQAKETAAVGRMVAGQVGRAAFSKATEAAGAVTSRVPGRTSSDAPRAAAPPVEKPAREEQPSAPEPAAKKAPAKKTPAKKTPAKKTPAKKTTAKKSTKKAAKKAPSKKAATTAPAKKAAKKAPAEKTAKKAPAPEPLTAQQVADVEDGPEVTTPVGTTAADVATNPDTTDTDLQQPGTEPLLDPGTASSIRSESETLRKAAESPAESAGERAVDEVPGEQPSS